MSNDAIEPSDVPQEFLEIIALVAVAIKQDVCRQYQNSDWDEAKDVIERCNYSEVSVAAILLLAEWLKRYKEIQRN